ncbi:MAG: CvpA family protein [Candidatus Omnitrophota bacterium]|jgi:uncharacterized membrane protein required for colicin V production
MDILTRINWVDVLVVILMLRTSYVAFQDGLSHEILPLFGIITGTVLALHYYSRIASLASDSTGQGLIGILNPISFAVIFMVVVFVFRLVGIITEKLIKITWHPMIEKAGGLIAGVAKAGVLTSAILMILVLIPLSYLKTSIRDKSLIGMYFLKIGPNIHAKIFNGENLLGGLVMGGDSAPAKKKAGSVDEWEKVIKP